MNNHPFQIVNRREYFCKDCVFYSVWYKTYSSSLNKMIHKKLTFMITETASYKEEMERIVPAIESLSKTFTDITLSIDTFQSKVAEAAILAGARIVNDISCGSFDPSILDIVSTYQADYIGMHITGTKETMHQVPDRENIIEDLIQYFLKKKEEKRRNFRKND